MSNENTATIAERFGNCHNPVLRWTPGRPDTLRIESRLTPPADGEADVTEFLHVEDFCDRAGECSPDTEMTDGEWETLLRWMAS